MVSNSKIAFVGSASTGKTTLANLLSKELSITLIPELESILLSAWINKGKLKSKFDFTLEQSKDFFEKSLRRREEITLQKNSYISDRSTADLYVYFSFYVEPKVDKIYSSNFKKRCEKVMQNYTDIILFPFGLIELKDNKSRTIDMQYQLNVDKKLRQTLDEFNLSFLELSTYDTSIDKLKEDILIWIRK